MPTRFGVDTGFGIGTVDGVTGTDLFDSIANLTGGRYDDTLTGNEHDNVLNVGGGADILEGGRCKSPVDWLGGQVDKSRLGPRTVGSPRPAYRRN
jgi:Ca2+-binding RTX toxin-like protein